ncbi:DUF2207 domain-containing protein [Pectobacterium sp. B1J-3]|uniref:DUF2207 domain-containing protein n=1 Tax=Pectobacterium sp. B1J-3 TaxID=3385371 RepID=UPI003905DA96
MAGWQGIIRCCGFLFLICWSALALADSQNNKNDGISVTSEATDYRHTTDERILLFDSQARFQTDGSMLVKENIQVRTTGEQIKRGIFRTLPLVWYRQDGSTFQLQYQIKQVLRDGVPENYSIDYINGHMKVLIGRASHQLEPGTYRYHIQYQVSNHFSRFPDWDELYWNVTGNGWGYPIDKVRFRLQLPEGTAFLTPTGKDSRLRSIDVYTGLVGSKGDNARILDDGSIETLAPLRLGEGVTVAYTWPRNILASAPAPQGDSLLGEWLSPTQKSWVLWIPSFLIAIYYLLWWRKHVAAARLTMPAVVPLYSIPDGVSPGYVRYLILRTYDNMAFSSDILDLVSRRAIALTKIKYKSRKTRRGGMTPEREEQWLTRLPDSASQNLTPEDRTFLKILFPGKSTKLDITENTLRSEKMLEARNAQEARYKEEQATLFLSISSAVKTGIILTLFVPILYGLFFDLRSAISTIISMPFLLICVVLFFKIMKYIRYSAMQRGSEESKILFFLQLVGFLFTLLFGLLLFNIFTSSALPEGYQRAWSVSLLLCLGFFCIVPRHTQKGLNGLSVAKGMTMYLRAAEERRYETLYPPDKLVMHFERMLPYALALGVGETWANTFAQYLKRHQVASDVFHNTGWESVSQFSRACTSSSSKPPRAGSGGGGGTSIGSGSSGGGSSGGGSGGGGGGGW